jgi:hypothetical protein
MNDTAVPAVEDMALPVDADRTPFYVVSKRKFAIMFMGTLGLYAFYWFYRNWDQYRDSIGFDSGSKIWPFPRAAFSIFFVHSLFGHIKESASDKDRVAQWSNTAHAWVMVALIAVDNGLGRLSARSIGSPLTDLLSLVILVPLVFGFLKAQEMINATCGDIEGKANHKLTGANWGWLFFGLLMWTATISNLMSAYHPSPEPYVSHSSW